MSVAEESRGAVEAVAPEYIRLAQFLSKTAGSRMDPHLVVEVAAEAIPHASDCAVTLTPNAGFPRTIAYTGAVPLDVDAIQYATRQGPCLDALDQHDLAVVDDLTTDGRWPDFARRCTAETPVRSMVSVRLLLDGRDRAALNVYAESPGRFEGLDVDVATMFAPFVALSVQSALHEGRLANLESALQTNRQIGTAIGILMAHRLLTSEQAFELLRQTSQNLNRKLHDVAAEVTLTGTLPEAAPPPGQAGRRMSSDSELRRQTDPPGKRRAPRRHTPRYTRLHPATSWSSIQLRSMRPGR